MSTFVKSMFVVVLFAIVLSVASPVLAETEAAGEVTLSAYQQGNVVALNTGRVASFTFVATAPAGYLNINAVRAYQTASYITVNGVGVLPMTCPASTSNCTGSVHVAAGDVVTVVDTNNAGYHYSATLEYEELNPIVYSYHVYAPMISK